MPLADDQYAAYESRPPEIEGPGPLGYLALVLAWAVPGLGHIVIGQRGRGLIFMATIHLLFAAGLLIGGIRSINPPDQAIWTYTQFLSGWPMVVANKVEHYSRKELGDPQAPRNTDQWKGELATEFETEAPHNESLEQRQERTIQFIKDHPLFANHPKIQDLGAVYCGIAGMLNLLVMFDVLLRITGSTREDPGAKNKSVAMTGAGSGK